MRFGVSWTGLMIWLFRRYLKGYKVRFLAINFGFEWVQTSKFDFSSLKFVIFWVWSNTKLSFWTLLMISKVYFWKVIKESHLYSFYCYFLLDLRWDFFPSSFYYVLLLYTLSWKLVGDLDWTRDSTIAVWKLLLYS